MIDSDVDSTINNNATIDICDFDLRNWTIHKFELTNQNARNKYGDNKIIKKVVNENKDFPNLVVIPGFSKKSFCGTVKRVIDNLHKLKKKFHTIYIFYFDEEKFKTLQTSACKLRDSIESEDLVIKYKPETDLNEELSKLIDKFIRVIDIKHVQSKFLILIQELIKN
jgi:hypothetical protein